MEWRSPERQPVTDDAQESVTPQKKRDEVHPSRFETLGKQSAYLPQALRRA
jgi:hypothetical protein